MRTVFLVLALAYSAYSADFSKIPLDDIIVGSIDYVPPSYQDVLDLMNQIRKFPVKRILGVYEQLVEGSNYWVVYQNVKDDLCVLFFNYRPWVAPEFQFTDVNEHCSSFLYVPTENKVVVKKLSQRSTIPFAYRRHLVDYDASESY